MNIFYAIKYIGYVLSNETHCEHACQRTLHILAISRTVVEELACTCGNYVRLSFK